MTTVVTPEPPPCVYDLFSTPASIDEAVAANSKDELYALCDDPMVRPVKLINENLHLDNSQDVRNCFIENSGFLVVGVIGLQGTGKSSVANLMANRLVEGPPCDGPFPVQTVASLIEGYPRTTAGVDMYITQDRVIILDTQPLRSWALTDLYIQQDLRSRHQQQQQQLEDVGGGPTGSGKWSVDGYAEMSSLQIIAFLVSVCHVVVCVQDNLSNPSLLRLINRAILMKPLVLVDDVLLVSHICGTARLLTTAADDAQPKQAKAKEEEVVEEEEPEVETAEDEKEEVENDEAPGSDETGLGQTCAVVRLSTSDSSMADNSATAASAAGSRSRMAQVDEVAEQAEVRSFVNQLQRLTDYAASLIHVYNAAPADAFLHPQVHDVRLAAYKRLLANALSARAHLASLVNLGPRILRRHMNSRRQRPQSQPREGPSVETDRTLQLVTTAGDLTEAKSEQTAPPTTLQSETSMRATEAEIVADCCKELEEEAAKASGKTKGPVAASATTKPSAVAVAAAAATSKTTVERFFEDDRLPNAVGDGEDRVVELTDLARRVAETRRMHFDPEKQAANPRLFLLPVTNEKDHILACEYRLEACLLSTQQLSRLTGEVPFGCPSYLQCAHLLQEAIFSTPRQHMMPDLTEIRWFEFARQTWQSIATSPLFIDYYRLWMNNTL